MAPARPPLRTVLIVATLLALVMLGSWQAIRRGDRAWFSESRCAGREEFSPPAWRDTTLAFGKAAVRGCMVDDLLEKHTLVGMTRAQIVGLLGDPSPPQADTLAAFELVYWLGPERGPIGTDSEWLAIRLDRDRVKSAELVTY